ncbi:MAG: PHP domain-containing protein [Acidobacteriota bacterium]
MDSRVDLHIHSSKSSDGEYTPLELLLMAKERGFRAISISDHDTVEAYPEALDRSRECGVELVPSVELTTLFQGREFHLLLPFIDWESRTLRQILKKVTQARLEEARLRVAKLQELGFEISWEEVSRESKGGPPLGVSIARTLIEKSRQGQNPALEKYYHGKNRLFAPYVFYGDYFLDDKPAFVPKRTVSLLDVLELVLADGAVPVLAHPGAYFERASAEDLKTLRERGLCGLEVYSSYHDRDQVRLYKSLAEELDLVATAGSDFHGRIKPHVPFGRIREGDYRMVERLKEKRRA